MEPLVAYLVDDDILVREAWKMRARKRGKRVEVFTSGAEIKAKLADLDKNLPLYVDSNLGSGEKGEALAKELFDAGFLTIYLATGYPPSHFPAMAWIKAVVPKDPPDSLFV